MFDLNRVQNRKTQVIRPKRQLFFLFTQLADQDSIKHLLGTQNAPNALHTAQPTWKQLQSVTVKRVTSGQKKTHRLWHVLVSLHTLYLKILIQITLLSVF